MFIFLILCSLLRLSSGTDLSPIIIIPGDGGNQLEARLDKPKDTSGCPHQDDWHRMWLDVWSLQGSRLKCWADNIKLVYNETSRTSSNVKGVYTRVPGFGDTSGVEYLDPSWSAWILADAGNYMKDMVEYFVSQGYVRGKSIRAAPYDFRFAPHSQVEYFNELKNLIEDTARRNNNKPVSIVSHSMGGLFGLHFLQTQDKDWLDRYISRFIPMNCPWLGATLQLITYASGYNMDISVISPLVIREEQRSYETGVYLLPNPHKWENLDQVLVHTPHRNYTVRNYPTFFNDIGYPQGKSMMDDVVNVTRLEHPGVKTTCIYSVGVPTPVGLEYSDGFPDTQPTRIKGDGDGSVTVNSLAYCSRFLNNPGDRNMVFRGLDHGQILKTTEVLEFIKSQLVL